jgi:hypothetical protein
MSDIVIEQPAVVEAELNYLVANGEKPATYAYEPPEGVPLGSGNYQTQRVKISNARVSPPPGGFSLDRNGFELHQHTSTLTDFSDPAAIERIYYPESEALLRRVTGAKRAVIFDHTLRDGRAVRADGVRDHLPPHEAEELLKGRVAIVNLWRPIGWTVESSPLALCDARSIALNDVVPSDLIYRDRIGETYAFVFNRGHRWYYFPLMSPDEVLLLKIYNSAGDGVARLTAHTAFDDPSSPPDARPRRSIELRMLLFF